MKKLCASILAFVVTVTVFAYTPIAVNVDNTPKTAKASVLETIKPTDNICKKTQTYIGNKNTKKFHLPTCYTLPKEKNRAYFSSRNRAIIRNFSPCKHCNP